MSVEGSTLDALFRMRASQKKQNPSHGYSSSSFGSGKWWLSGWWLTYPSEKCSSNGIIVPNIWKHMETYLKCSKPPVVGYFILFQFPGGNPQPSDTAEDLSWDFSLHQQEQQPGMWSHRKLRKNIPAESWILTYYFLLKLDFDLFTVKQCVSLCIISRLVLLNRQT